MSRSLTYVLLALVLAGGGLIDRAPQAEAAAPARPGRYTNPLRPTTTTGATVQSCADPSVLRGRGRQAGSWYMYCTSDPLNDAETSGSGAPTFHRLPTLRSRDLVHWRFVGSALPGPPGWAAAGSTLWAPDVVYSRTFHRYYLTFAVTDTRTSVSGEKGCTSDPAIGVAVSRTPTGPWTTKRTPLVPPRRTGPGCSFASTIDPDVLGGVVGAQATFYFGGFRDGIFGQGVRLSRTGMARTGTPTRVTAGRRYEGANVVHRGRWYYLTVSSGACCYGAMSGYGVFSGRSRSPLGPFLDRDGVSLRAARVGGTPLAVMNGNRWVGPGHSSLFQDRGGRWWLVYHAIVAKDPYFATETGFTRRPPMLDPVDWVRGWPVLRAGRGPSQSRMPGPAGRRGQSSAYRPSPPAADTPGALIAASSDEFDGGSLGPQWSWVRRPKASAYRVKDGALRLDTAPGQLYLDDNTAPVLTVPAPDGDFVAQTVVHLDVPATGEGYDGTQAGLVVYGSDDRYVKLVHVAVGEARVTSLAREVASAPKGWPRYGASSAGPPGEATTLRLVRRTTGGRTTYRAWTRSDGAHWVRGPAWSHPDLDRSLRIGFLAMGESVHAARFEYLRVSRLRR